MPRIRTVGSKWKERQERSTIIEDGIPAFAAAMEQLYKDPYMPRLRAIVEKAQMTLRASGLPDLPGRYYGKKGSRWVPYARQPLDDGNICADLVSVAINVHGEDSPPFYAAKLLQLIDDMGRIDRQDDPKLRLFGWQSFQIGRLSREWELKPYADAGWDRQNTITPILNAKNARATAAKEAKEAEWAKAAQKKWHTKTGRLRKATEVAAELCPEFEDTEFAGAESTIRKAIGKVRPLR